MSADSLLFLLKVLALSAAGAIAVKYGAPMGAIAPVGSVALAIVLLPSVVLGLLLAWRSKQATR
ncbi:MAG: hypothetical protein KME20_04090 [Kaiparowitsia implicata GSE-PSE-MK54-09C]|jgi:uncharacterized membrane protein|nr:hypothetical protein [Kaiparowitsia implicata GSE-PSE-MK54-09C]